ncbi:MAG: hypothetical protein IPO27_18590 [Bacteroidetes bacterium]|nr:hypothetical protein [Bacteroidota bacterium]
MPNFTLSSSVSLKLKYETFCRTDNFNFKEIILVGDSVGTQRMLKFNITVGIVVNDIVLADDFKNSKFATYGANNAFLFASPGDTITNLLRYNFISSVATTTNLFPNLGIAFANTNESMPVYYQAMFDGSPKAMHKKIISYSRLSNTFDTIINNVYCNAAHSNTYGFSSPPYMMIMAP